MAGGRSKHSGHFVKLGLSDVAKRNRGDAPDRFDTGGSTRFGRSGSRTTPAVPGDRF